MVSTMLHPFTLMVGHMTVVTCYLGFLALSWYLPDRLFFVIVRNRRNGPMAVIVSSTVLFILTFVMKSLDDLIGYRKVFT